MALRYNVGIGQGKFGRLTQIKMSGQMCGFAGCCGRKNRSMAYTGGSVCECSLPQYESTHAVLFIDYLVRGNGPDRLR